MNKTTPSRAGDATPPMTRRVLKFCAGILITLAAVAASAAFVLGIAFALAYSNLPDISELLNYYPKQPLRVYSADGDLIGEFGEERRSMVESHG